MILGLLSPRDFAIGTEVALIVAGMWSAKLVREEIHDIQDTGDWPIEEDGCSSVPHEARSEN